MRNSWNTFDFLVVLASTVDFLINLVVRGVGNFDTKVLNALRVFRVVRALRALRVLRTIRFLRNLQIIVTTILRSIPALGNIVILAALVLYIFAIIGRGLYGDADPARFGNLGRASVTLFQLITLDDWYYAYSERDDDTQHILLYLFIFIVLETFIFINLFVAVIVDSLGRAQAAADDQSTTAAAEAEAAHINDDVTDITSSQLLSDDGDSALSDGVDETTVRNYYDDVTDADFDLIRRYYASLASLEHHLKEDAVQREAIYELVDLLDIAKVPTRRN
ncbi:cation channel sperm-associated protein 1-like [Oscarella lobularis]|uniref:cation channel sperm-associated protein 1-like n=1 Tax=Oscarella lobularis TaxID=121494 RepID=UPI003313B8EB